MTPKSSELLFLERRGAREPPGGLRRRGGQTVGKKEETGETPFRRAVDALSLGESLGRLFHSFAVWIWDVLS